MKECKVTEKVINRVEMALGLGIPLDEIVQMLADDEIEGYDAYLAVKAAEVSIRMRIR